MNLFDYRSEQPLSGQSELDSWAYKITIEALIVSHRPKSWPGEFIVLTVTLRQSLLLSRILYTRFDVFFEQIA